MTADEVLYITSDLPVNTTCLPEDKVTKFLFNHILAKALVSGSFSSVKTIPYR